MAQRPRYCFLSLEDGNNIVGRETPLRQPESERVQRSAIETPGTERLRGAVHDCMCPITYSLRGNTVQCNPPDRRYASGLTPGLSGSHRGGARARAENNC